MIERVEKNKILYAIIVRSNYKEKDCIKFFTPNEFSQQLAYMNRSKGYKIKPHIHKKNKKITSYTQEVLFIKSGKKCKIGFTYSSLINKPYLTVQQLKKLIIKNVPEGKYIL